MAELNLHRIEKIEIIHDFIKEGDRDEFSVIKIFIESPTDLDVKKFEVCFFLQPDAELTVKNLLLAISHGRVKPPVEKEGGE